MDKSTLLAATHALLNAINTHGRLTDPVTGRDAVDIDVITAVLYSIAENAETGLYEKSIKIE